MPIPIGIDVNYICQNELHTFIYRHSYLELTETVSFPAMVDRYGVSSGSACNTDDDPGIEFASFNMKLSAALPKTSTRPRIDFWRKSTKSYWMIRTRLYLTRMSKISYIWVRRAQDRCVSIPPTCMSVVSAEHGTTSVMSVRERLFLSAPSYLMALSKNLSTELCKRPVYCTRYHVSTLG